MPINELTTINELSSALDIKIFLTSIYTAMSISQWFSNLTIIYILISGILFENILINKILLPLIRGKLFRTKINENETEKKIVFWFNDWLYEKDTDTIPLDKEEMFIPFLNWKRHKHKHVRALYTRAEKSCKSRIKKILTTCILWNILCVSISFPLEFFGATLPLRIFTLCFLYIGPALIWDSYLSEFITIKYISDEYRTPRVTMIIIFFFIIIPTFLLVQTEYNQFFYGIFIPWLKNNGFAKLVPRMFKTYRRGLKLTAGLYSFWCRFGYGFAITLALSAILDNWWDVNILTRFEKSGKELPESAFFLDAYRIRNTDKLLASYAYIIVALEIFGKNWFKFWEPRIYSFMREIKYIELKHETPANLIFSDWDGILIRQHAFDNEIISHIAIWINHIFNPEPFRIIGISMWQVYTAWPGITGFLLAMLFRGLRYRGPDTYPNFGGDLPRLPTRTPWIAFNANYYDIRDKRQDRIRSTPEEDKLIQFLPKCKWHKYFVRWNWTFVFTLSLLYNLLYRGIIIRLVGTPNWKLITVSSETLLKIKYFVFNMETTLWFYGLICCFLGICASFPVLSGVCRFHVGLLIEIKDKFLLQEETPLLKYPYDVIELKKILRQQYPKTKITRAKKIKLFLQIQIEKLKNNLSKILLLIFILIFFSYSYLDDLNGIHQYVTSDTLIDYVTPTKEDPFLDYTDLIKLLNIKNFD